MRSDQKDLNAILAEEKNWGQQADTERRSARGELTGGYLAALAGLLAVIWFMQQL